MCLQRSFSRQENAWVDRSAVSWLDRCAQPSRRWLDQGCGTQGNLLGLWYTILLSMMLRCWMLHWQRPDIGCYAKRHGELTRWVLLKPATTCHWPTSGLVGVADHFNHPCAPVCGAPQTPLANFHNAWPCPTTVPPHVCCNPSESHLMEDAAPAPNVNVAADAPHMQVGSFHKQVPEFAALYVCVLPTSIAYTSVLASTFKI